MLASNAGQINQAFVTQQISLEWGSEDDGTDKPSSTHLWIQPLTPPAMPASLEEIMLQKVSTIATLV